MSNPLLRSLSLLTFALGLFAGIGLYGYSNYATSLQVAEVTSVGVPVTFTPSSLTAHLGTTQVATLSATLTTPNAQLSGIDATLSFDPQKIEILSVVSTTFQTTLRALSIQNGNASFAFGLTPAQSREPRVCTMDFDPNNSGSCTDYNNNCRNYGNACTRANVCATPLHSCTANTPDPYALATVTYKVKDGSPGTTTLTLTPASQLAVTTSNTNVLTTTPSHTITLTPPFLPGDLDEDGGVDLYDFNLLVSKFGNPYTIYDFNNIIINYGRSQ